MDDAGVPTISQRYFFSWAAQSSTARSMRLDENCLCFITVQSVCLPAAFNFESVIEVFNWANRQTQLTQPMIL